MPIRVRISPLTPIKQKGFSGLSLTLTIRFGTVLTQIRQTNPLSKSKAPELNAMVQGAETKAVNASRIKNE